MINKYMIQYVLIILIICHSGQGLNFSHQGHDHISTLTVDSFTVELNMNFNNFVTIPFGYFVNMPQLQKLHITNNQIKNISDFAFSNLSSLTNLNIESNKLETIRENVRIYHGCSKHAKGVSDTGTNYQKGIIHHRSLGNLLQVWEN